MRVGGILETALHVADLARSAGFYRRFFGLGTLMETEQPVAIDVAGRNVLRQFPQGGTAEPFVVPGGLNSPHGGSGHLHLASSIAADGLGPWPWRLAAEGVPIESEVS